MLVEEKMEKKLEMKIEYGIPAVGSGGEPPDPNEPKLPFEKHEKVMERDWADWTEKYAAFKDINKAPKPKQEPYVSKFSTDWYKK